MSGLPVQLSTMLAGAPRADANVAGDPALEADPLRVSLIDGLVAAGEADKDVQEPSWELLGRLLQDVTFVHAYRRLEFFRSGLGLPPASYEDGVKSATELLANHPYVTLLRAMPMGGGAPLKKAIGEAKLVDVDLNAYIEIQRYWRIEMEPGKPYGQPLWDAIVRHADDIAQDCERVGHYAPDPAFGRRLQVISEYSPQAIMLMAMKDPTISQTKLKQWEEQFGRHADVLMAIAQRYDRQRPARRRRALPVALCRAVAGRRGVRIAGASLSEAR